MIDDGILLIVDDAASNRLLLKAIFKNEYKIEEAENGQQALEVLERSEGRVLAILLDLVMPVMDGYQFLDHFKKIPDSSKIPVIVITGDMSIESQNRGFTLGIADYIAKPFATSVVKHRVRNLVDLFEHQNNLEYLVEKQSSKIREQSSKLISALSTLVEFRDLESGQHINRIKFFTGALMSEVSRAHPEYGFTQLDIENIAIASALHDIGKIAIPDNILQKPGHFSNDEFEIMKMHTLKGADIIKTIGCDDPSDPFFKYGYEIALYHHERWDGRGYPQHLKGDQIPISAQVVSVVDVFDALIAERCYKSAFSYEDAYDMILAGKCGNFNPMILKCFVNIRSEIEKIADELMH